MWTIFCSSVSRDQGGVSGNWGFTFCLFFIFIFFDTGSHFIIPASSQLKEPHMPLAPELELRCLSAPQAFARPCTIRGSSRSGELATDAPAVHLPCRCLSLRTHMLVSPFAGSICLRRLLPCAVTLLSLHYAPSGVSHRGNCWC